MPFQNAGGVAAITAVPRARQIYPRDMHWGTMEAMFQTRIKILYRKRRTACCSVTDVRVSGTWQLIADTCHVASAVASHIASSFVQGRATTPYVAIAPGLTMPVDLFLCRVDLLYRSSLTVHTISHQYPLHISDNNLMIKVTK